jgi:exopolysaccharide production protein ExoQ
MMLKHVSAPVKPDRVNVRILGSTVLAIVPVLVNYYVLLVLPFINDDGKGRIENNIFWPTVAGITLALVLYNRLRFDTGFISSLPVKSLFAYLVFAAASIGWAYSPDYAFSRLVVNTLAIIIVILPYALPIRTTRAIQSLYVCYAIALAVNAVYVLTYPPSPLGHPGYFTHKQTLGMFCATAVIFSAHELLFRGWRCVLAVVGISVAIWLLFESESKSALIFSVFAMALAGFVLLACKIMRTTPAHILAAIAVGSLFFSDPVGRIGYRLYGDATISGRTPLWEFVEYQISTKPWFGWGFHSYYFVPNSPQEAAWGPDYVKHAPSSHSGYLDLKLETGKIGYWIFLIFLYSSLHGLEFVRRKDPRRAWLFLSVTIYAILVNFIDTAWLGLNQLWMLQLVVVAETVRYSRSSNSGSTLYQPAEVLTLGGIPKSEDR